MRAAEPSEGRIADMMRAALDRVRRWRLRREMDEMVKRPYGEPPFPFTYEQWEEYCRNEEALRPSEGDENGPRYLR